MDLSIHSRNSGRNLDRLQSFAMSEQRLPRQSACSVELSIQEIVLSDVSVKDPQLLKQTVSAELTRLFQSQGVPPTLSQRRHSPTLSAGAISVSPAGTNSLGIEIAQAIYRGLHRGLDQ